MFMTLDDDDKFPTGTKIYKTSGDYTFEGVVIAVIYKLSGAKRYVVEDERGLLLIMSEAQLKSTPKGYGAKGWDDVVSQRPMSGIGGELQRIEDDETKA